MRNFNNNHRSVTLESKNNIIMYRNVSNKLKKLTIKERRIRNILLKKIKKKKRNIYEYFPTIYYNISQFFHRISTLLFRVSFFPFLLFSRYIERKYWILENFRHPVFDGLHVLRCPKHNLIIFRKCLSVCMYVSKIL